MDLGAVYSLQAPTLAELKTKISSEYFNLDKPIGADVQLYDGAIEICFDGEHDYRKSMDERDHTPFLETIRITISQVDETYLDLSNDPLFKNIGAN